MEQSEVPRDVNIRYISSLYRFVKDVLYAYLVVCLLHVNIRYIVRSFVINVLYGYLIVCPMPQLAVLREASCHDSGPRGCCEPDCEVRSTGDSCRLCDGDRRRVELHVCQQGSPPQFLISSERMLL